jgi:hypothetical protein
MILTLVAASLTGCGDSVPLEYSTRADADAESVFARGWLPEIIPASSQAISMRNELDLNTSKGEFTFDPSDHDEFVKHLRRTPSKDRSGFTAYSHEGWNFWISDNKDRCRFYMRLSGDKKTRRVRRQPDA